MTVVRHAGLAAALCALALGTGCAAVQANRRTPGSIANGAFTPGRAGSAQYGPNPALLCPTGGAFPSIATRPARRIPLVMTMRTFAASLLPISRGTKPT